MGRYAQLVGDAFGAQTDKGYDFDRCDFCDAFLHSACVLTYRGLKGEYGVCGPCLDARSQREFKSALHGDFRTTPMRFWRNLHEQFLRPAERMSTSVASDAGVAVEARVAEEDLVQPLNNCLEYIDMFLEGQHTKSGSVSESCSSRIWVSVRAAL